MKKKKIEEFLDMNLKGEKLDQLMKEILEEKFDNELKSKYSKILQDEFDVQRHDKNQAKPKRVASKVGLLVLLLSVIMSAGYFVINHLSKSQNELPTYLAENQLLYQGSTRNETKIMTASKSRAYNLFNKGEYKTFLELLSSESRISTEDTFFRGYARMVQESYQEALIDFDGLLKTLQPGQKYYQEAILYKGICLSKVDESKFRTYYKELNSKSYAKGEIDKIFN